MEDPGWTFDLSSGWLTEERGSVVDGLAQIFAVDRERPLMEPRSKNGQRME
jgi:hypothetical protein